MNRNQERAVLFAVIGVVLIGAFFVGAAWSGARRPPTPPSNLENHEKGQPPAVDFSLFWNVWRRLDERFVATPVTATSAPAEVSDQERVWGAIAGLVRSLGDPYTEFLAPEDNKIFAEDIQGSFGGIGIEIGVRDGRLTVIAPLEGSPAKQAGLRTGDSIVEIDGVAAARLSVARATSRIRGEVGTTVTLGILRPGAERPQQLKIQRGIIRVPTIETKLLPEKVFLIKLFNFGATAPSLFRAALREFVQSGADRMIIDLRGNPGGYLEAAVNIASWFLPAGRPVVLEERGAGLPRKIYRSYGFNVFGDKLKLVVLVDGGSASAAEILAGALSEGGRAKLVGEKTFGKGSVQELVPLTDDTSLKITVAHWLTPNGVQISPDGLTPEVVVELPPDRIGQADDNPILKHGLKIVLAL